jgi:isoleucyl-tRNA synthetase
MAQNPKVYPDVDPNPNFAQLEEQVLKFWEEDHTFQKSVDQRPHGNGNDYVFYDGPPFANGLPHYGHLLTGYVKDAVARYQTMRGKRVERRFGWDCHGLPAEMGAEKELHITGRAAIIDYGIGKFNDYCRNNVMRYVADWEYYVSRQGRWVDFRNDYKTMDKNFMESVIWAFSELYKKGWVYEAFRVMPYSWAAETPLSNFETRMDNATREREDKAAYVSFKLKSKPAGAPDAENYYIVAWTTTPWTLPSNLALAVNQEMKYFAVSDGKNCYIYAESAKTKLVKSMMERLDETGMEVGVLEAFLTFHSSEPYSLPKGVEPASIHDPNHKNGTFIPGANLIGLTYEPLFPYLVDTKNAFRVIDGGEAVTEGEGTGVIHMAPGFGEIDQKVCAENGIEVIVPVDGQGKFTDEIYDMPWNPFPAGGESNPLSSGLVGVAGNTANTPSQPPATLPNPQSADLTSRQREMVLSLKGLVVVPDTRITLGSIQVSDEDSALHIDAKDVQKYGLANMRILRWLKLSRKALVKEEPYKHNYPHCWRTDTPIIYRAMSSWYVAVTKFRDRAVELNQQINWIPEHVKNGQMGHMLATAPDWSISRNRFWGTPIPIWRSPSGKLMVPGSIAEIEAWSGQQVADLHRPIIDEITFEKDGETYTRVEDVFDCWFESGSMPYAQLHYPFENKQLFEENFPADFITEYVGQTRGWFNTLIMLSTALFDKPPFQNCICHGVVIDEESGLKYSKRLKNYRDPKEVMDAYGADALRWMMLASPVMRGADMGVDPEGKFIRDVVRLNIKPLWSAYNFFTLYANADGVKAKSVSTTANMLDQYILAKCKAAVEQVQASLDAYDTPGATEAITAFFDVLNNWYIRRSRARFWGSEVTPDKQAAYDTLYTVLTHMVTAAAPLLPFTTEMVYRGLVGEKESVHLQAFPDVSAISASPELINDMDWVQGICTAASSVRNRQNIRNRQPLSLLGIYGNIPIARRWFETQKSEDLSRWEELREMIKEELNVKDVQGFSFPQWAASETNDYTLPSNFDEVATKKLVINSQVLGKRLPAKMKEILPASKKGEWEYDNNVGIIIAGENLAAKNGEYNIILEAKNEYKDSAQAVGDNVVVLDLNITPELESEGRARDLVRMVQQARKDAGLHVADRITLALDIPADFKAALATHKDYIAEQVLAVSIGDDATTSDKKSTQELDGEQFTIGISKAA